VHIPHAINEIMIGNNIRVVLGLQNPDLVLDTSCLIPVYHLELIVRLDRVLFASLLMDPFADDCICPLANVFAGDVIIILSITKAKITSMVRPAVKLWLVLFKIFLCLGKSVLEAVIRLDR
jgi:hypothetical protein